MKQSSSLSTDHNLVDILWKDFVDKSLLSILWFDNTFLDFAGFDTFDSMYRARSNFQITWLLIPNHINYCPRSVYIARHLTMDAYCVTMPKRFKPRTIGGYYRESFAKIKARFNVVLWSKAYFASSDLYPIHWTGNAGMFY